MAISPHSRLKFGDGAGLASWMQAHDLEHRAYAKALLRKGQQVPALPLSGAMTKEWMLAHQVHHKMLLRHFVPGTTTQFNLTTDPITTSVQFYTWMNNHNAIHQRVNRSLNKVVRS